MIAIERETLHPWLESLVGHWMLEGEAEGGPGLPPRRFSGTEHVRALGGPWLLADGMSAPPDGPASTGLTLLGFDPRRGRFVGSRFASDEPHQWIYEGTLDAEAGALTLETEGPRPADGGEPVRYRQRVELRGPDLRTLTSARRGADGRWREHLVVRYRRTGW